MKPQHLNPPTLPRKPAFSQAVVAHGPGRLIVVGGQNAVDESGRVVGDDLDTQSKPALGNVLNALAAAGAQQEDVVRLAVDIRSALDVADGFKAAGEVRGPHPTAITVLEVGLSNPAFLVEIEATAFLADRD
jgi:enamine deaminase RidA (YjgF/YER057c/UK114 family)